jgi:hypothetical protein
MPRVGLEPTITASERAKTVHALDRSATVTGTQNTYLEQIYSLLQKTRVDCRNIIYK